MPLTLTPISRDQLPKVATRTNSASSAMFKEFTDGTEPGDICQVNIPEDAKGTESVRSTLQNYIARHELAIKLFSRAGNLYMEHLSAEDYADYRAEAAEKSARRAPRGSKTSGGVAVAASVTDGDAFEPDTDEG